MVFISQNFFDYKYDYREEWLRMTQELANLSDEPPLPERSIRILADLVESNAGAIWIKSDQNNYELKSSVNIATPKHTMLRPNAVTPTRPPRAITVCTMGGLMQCNRPHLINW